MPEAPRSLVGSVTVESAAFEWGWDALVAIGTLALAVATVLLAWSTRRMAKATAQDVAAQWRPALTPGHDVEVRHDERTKHAMATLRNVGAGAAYYLDIGLDLGGTIIPAAPWEPDGAQPSNFAVLPAGESIDLHFMGVDERPEKCELIADYEDVAGASYSTRIAISTLIAWYPEARDDEALRMTRVTLSTGGGIVPWSQPPSLWSRSRTRYDLWRRRKDFVTIKPGDDLPF
jgi:hypothetical protein